MEGLLVQGQESTFSGIFFFVSACSAAVPTLVYTFPGLFLIPLNNMFFEGVLVLVTELIAPIAMEVLVSWLPVICGSGKNCLLLILNCMFSRPENVSNDRSRPWRGWRGCG